MPDWVALNGAMLLRLSLAALAGAAVAWIRGRSSKSDEMGASFPATLVLLAVLIAMVTQVIGDNVARAFSLVGALSIVRFRTVVRDTRDTAFVIFAVVEGMAVGSHQPALALVGLLVGGAAAFAMHRGVGNSGGNGWRPERKLRVRCALGVRIGDRLTPLVDSAAQRWRLAAVGTAKQATVLEAEWELTLKPEVVAEELVRDMGAVDGVQDVMVGWYASEERSG
jgi:hypothetical protein